MEPALACLHKLVREREGERGKRKRRAIIFNGKKQSLFLQVSHAYIQGESSPSGALDDGTVVARVVAAAASASARPGAPPAIALGALQTLLAACTADHFVPHGDTLMAAVRAQFAAALGGPDPARGAARGALLQTLATSLKRVAHAAPLSRDVSGAELGWGVRRGGGDGGHLGAAAADAGAHSSVPHVAVAHEKQLANVCVCKAGTRVGAGLKGAPVGVPNVARCSARHVDRK